MPGINGGTKFLQTKLGDLIDLCLVSGCICNIGGGGNWGCGSGARAGIANNGIGAKLSNQFGVQRPLHATAKLGMPSVFGWI